MGFNHKVVVDKVLIHCFAVLLYVGLCSYIIILIDLRMVNMY
jgi:hypothetical protein